MSDVLLKSAEGINSILPETIMVRDNAGNAICVDILCRGGTVGDLIMFNVDKFETVRMYGKR